MVRMVGTDREGGDELDAGVNREQMAGAIQTAGLEGGALSRVLNRASREVVHP